MDFGRSMYQKTPDIRVDTYDSEYQSGALLRQPRENKTTIQRPQNIRPSMNFGNVSIRDLQRSLTDQLSEKEEHEEERTPEPVSNITDSKSGLFLETCVPVAMHLSSSFLSKENVKTSEKRGQDKPKVYNKEKSNLNKSVTIKKPLLDDLKGVSVKDLSSSVIKSMLNKNTEVMVSNTDTDTRADSYELQHAHCLSCYDRNCTKVEDCPVVKCENKCHEASFHKCKQREHDELCKYKVIKCINESLGCKMEMPRCKLALHLKHCTQMQQPEIQNLHLPEKKVNRYSGDFVTHTPSLKDHKNIHQHCLNCYAIKCVNQQECKIKNCPNKGCSMRLHACKIREHKRICQFKLIPCINKEYGCEYRFSRIILAEHLRECPVMNYEALSLPPYNLINNKEQGHHCDSCYSSKCNFPVEEKCQLVRCYCGVMLHQCKFDDHYENTCPWHPMPCINQQAGCQMFLTRCMLTTHLQHCTAMNWNFRKTPKNDEEDNNSVEKLEITSPTEPAMKSNEEHVYQKLHRKKKNKRSCKVM